MRNLYYFKNGYILPNTLLVITVMVLVIGISLKGPLSEKVRNEKQLLNYEAQNAVKSIIEYGIAEIITRLNNGKKFHSTVLHPDNNPLEIPASGILFFSSTNIDMNYSELIGGKLSPGEFKYFDPEDNTGKINPLISEKSFVREVTIYGKAAAISPRDGSTVLAHAEVTLLICDSPLNDNTMNENISGDSHTYDQQYIRTFRHNSYKELTVEEYKMKIKRLW